MPIDLPWAITLSIDSDTMALTSQCLQPRWRYNYANGTLRTAPIARPLCDRGRYPAEAAVLAAIEGATRAERTPENGILLSGNAGSLLIFSQ
ncbi:META domain-containing protein [Porphyrobacter sp. GA68]|uniref:META domain-containing protein n=1 Tax=Porphyrobacter sp. GA68 TaxID=2883480 RepID=UPI001D191363|nr:META domain-containing protein [Porphyrobacter sp. GA68]